MRSVGLFEAKTHLSALVERAEKGESILITKHGRPVAKLVPAEDRFDRKAVSDAVEWILEFRKSHRLDGLTIRELIDEGRRH